MDNNQSVSNSTEDESRVLGKVKWFNKAKGYGFISQENGSDVFVHLSGIQANGFKVLYEEEEVEFLVINGKNGLQADQVTGPGGTQLKCELGNQSQRFGQGGRVCRCRCWDAGYRSARNESKNHHHHRPRSPRN